MKNHAVCDWHMRPQVHFTFMKGKKAKEKKRKNSGAQLAKLKPHSELMVETGGGRGLELINIWRRARVYWEGLIGNGGWWKKWGWRGAGSEVSLFLVSGEH